MSISLVIVDSSGLCSLLAPGLTVNVGPAANVVSYQWSTLYNMANTDLKALNIYKVDNSVTIPDGYSLNSIVYEYSNNAVLATPIFSQIPVVAPNTSVDFVRAQLNTDAVQACQTVSAQIVPDLVHQNAYLNAAAMIGTSGTLPSSDPIKTQFNALASSVGLTPSQFANVVINVAATSFALSATLITLQTACQTANNMNDLTNARDAFDVSLGSIVDSLNSSGLVVNITKPAKISIPGLFT